MAAGISITFGLSKYGQALDGLTLAQRREEIRMSVGTLNDETLYGQIRFNRFNQNNGRMSVNWQILEDGGTRQGRVYHCQISSACGRSNDIRQVDLHCARPVLPPEVGFSFCFWGVL